MSHRIDLARGQSAQTELKYIIAKTEGCLRVLAFSHLIPKGDTKMKIQDILKLFDSDDLVVKEYGQCQEQDLQAWRQEQERLAIKMDAIGLGSLVMPPIM